MLHLSKKLDQLLLDIAWSLWTELGVAGVKRKHQNVLIGLEELVLLTVALAEVDPRLRDESLDWCSQYAHFFSISRLKSELKGFEELLGEPFSIYAATINSLGRNHWPLIQNAPPLNIVLSRKSCLRPRESAALLSIRTRSIFGAGARADLITFFLTHPQLDFAASELSEIGYSKRNLALILDEFCLSGLFNKFQVRNQQRYRLTMNNHLINILGPIPKMAPSWKIFLELVLPLRACLKRIEQSSNSTQIVEIRKFLTENNNSLQKLNITPPPIPPDLSSYLSNFSEWLEKLESLVALI